MSIMNFIALIIVGLFFGLIAGIYSNKSSKETRGESLSKAGAAFYLLFGGGLALLFALSQTLNFSAVMLWILIAVLVVLAIFQANNREGKHQMGAWDSLAVLSVILLIFTIAARMDELEMAAPNPLFLLFLIPMALPFIVGAIRVHLLNIGYVWQGRKIDVDFRIGLGTVTALAVVIVCIIGLSTWAFS